MSDSTRRRTCNMAPSKAPFYGTWGDDRCVGCVAGIYRNVSTVGMLILILICGASLSWPGRTCAKVPPLATGANIPTLDPSAGLIQMKHSPRINALKVVESLQPPPAEKYLRHLYFQPLHVTVLHGRTAFAGLADVAGSMRANRSLRPGYRGNSPLVPAHRISLLAVGAHSAPPPELLLDFGQEVAGRIQVRGSGGTILIGTGESRGEALHKPWGGVHALDLTGGNTLSTPYSGFRYATVVFQGHGRIKLNRLRLDFKYYPVHYRGAFRCADPLLTRIWYTGAYTAHLCMQEEIWDAPKRDRSLWMGDTQISGEVINNAFLDRFLMELTMSYLRNRAQGDLMPRGLPMGGEWHGARFFNRPADVLPVRDVNAIPGYSCAWICTLADFYKHTGAMGYLRSQHQLLLSMLRYMRSGFNRKNLFINSHNEWNFVDWVPLLNGGKFRDAATDTRQARINTDLYTCWAVKRAVFLLKALGDHANAEKYMQWHTELVKAARRYLVNPHTETYTSLPQPNAMAILSKVADARQRAAINAHIFGPHNHFWRKIGTPYCMNFALFALSDLGQTNRALAFVRRYWGGMLKDGATTFWEAYRMSAARRNASRQLGYRTSLCHGWSAGATNWLTQYILGVNPVAGGFRRVDITPHMGDLKWIAGKVPTPNGPIRIRLQRIGNRRSLGITLPENVRATIALHGTRMLIKGAAAVADHVANGRIFVQLDKPGHYTIIAR